MGTATDDYTAYVEESWTRLFKDAGHAIDEIREPIHPERGTPVSILFLCHR